MTWLGKILAVLVFILALVWMWFTVTVFVTRANWKAVAEGYKQARQEAVAAREAEYRQYQQEKDALAREVASLKSELASAKKTEAALAKVNQENRRELSQITAALGDYDKRIVQLQSSYDRAIQELNTVRERNATLETERVELVIRREQAERDRQGAQNEAKLARQIADDLARQVDNLVALNQELRASGGTTARGLPGTPGRQAPRAPENVRGTVTAVEGDQVEISIGLDAGVGIGTVLDVYRLTGGGRHLGTLVVTDVRAKSAVGTFQSASGRPVNRLLPEQRPQVNDTVGRLDSNRAMNGR
jgi:cell division protein FtsB